MKQVRNPISDVSSTELFVTAKNGGNMLAIY